VLGGKLVRLIESDAERRRMRLNENIGRRDPVREIGALGLVARVLMSAKIVPRPTIEGARRDMRCIVRRQVVAEAVTLVDRAPGVAGSRLDCEARTIANVSRVNALVPATRIKGERLRAAPSSPKEALSGASAISASSGRFRPLRRCRPTRPRRTTSCRRARKQDRAFSVLLRSAGSRSSRPNPRLSSQPLRLGKKRKTESGVATWTNRRSGPDG
jgi:hypothetical protein